MIFRTLASAIHALVNKYVTSPDVERIAASVHLKQTNGKTGL